jgi:RND family efflux transporter MFP subunit
MMPLRSLLLTGLAGMTLLSACGKSPKEGVSAAPAAKPALSVTATMPQAVTWPLMLQAGGNVAAWQEAVIGPEISNYRITEVRANVGDVVRKGQLLARIDAETVTSEYTENSAAVAEAAATLAEARANHERARQLAAKGFYSAQQSNQTLTAVGTAQARLDAAKARLHSAELKRSKSAVLAPDDGIISARGATVGTLTQPGQELFRLIRGGRLEWRAEVTAAELARIAPGVPVTLTSPGGETVAGQVRAVAPTVDPQTRYALVYVDLPSTAAEKLSAGMFARGEFQLGASPALVLPQSAVLLREGFAYVFRIEGADSTKVAQTKIATGRRNGDLIEVVGLAADSRVATGGVSFLADGDTVRVVAAPAGAPSGGSQ